MEKLKDYNTGLKNVNKRPINDGVYSISSKILPDKVFSIEKKNITPLLYLLNLLLKMLINFFSSNTMNLKIITQ